MVELQAPQSRYVLALIQILLDSLVIAGQMAILPLVKVKVALSQVMVLPLIMIPIT
jgi:hypothetical protein